MLLFVRDLFLLSFLCRYRREIPPHSCENLRMMQSRCFAVATLLTSLSTAVPVFAQNDRRVFVGGLIGVSTLSADGRAVTMAPEAALSSYKPENGFTMNLFGGAHVAQYF